MERILIVRLGAMGDVIHALPAVARLRAAAPDAHIGWLVEDRWHDLLRVRASQAPSGTSEAPLVDAVHSVNTKRWRKNLLARDTRAQIAAVLQQVRGARYQLAFDFQGAIKSGAMATMSGSPRVVGYAHPRETIASIFYSRRVETRAPHVVDQALELVASMFPADSELAAPLPRDGEAERWAADAAPYEHFAILNPGAGWGAKCWPAARFGLVARALHERGIRALLNAGPGEEEMAADVVRTSGGVAEVIRCTMPQLIALTRRAQLFIGGDTGPMHLAAALKVPVVALFGPTDPARNGPHNVRSEVLRSAQSRTSYSHVAGADPGLQSIQADEVIAAAHRLLEEPRA